MLGVECRARMRDVYPAYHLTASYLLHSARLTSKTVSAVTED